jgi:transcription elongation factor GreA
VKTPYEFTLRTFEELKQEGDSTMLKVRLTQQGFERLQTELEELRARRAKLRAEVGAARDQGDLRENAGYHAAREALGWIEARIKLMEDRLTEVEIVEADAVPQQVEVGVTVTLMNLDDGTEDHYTLVDGAELGTRENPISLNSPLGRVLLGKTVGDTVEVQAPRGLMRWEIVELRRE